MLAMRFSGTEGYRYGVQMEEDVNLCRGFCGHSKTFYLDS